MPVEPSHRISETPNIRQEENTPFQKRNKPKQPKAEDKKEQEKTGIIDIKV
jgi:hypothetical protein